MDAKIKIPEKLWSVQDCADFFGVSKNAIYMRIAKNTIPYFKLGSQVRFNPDDVMEYLNKHKIEPVCEN